MLALTETSFQGAPPFGPTSMLVKAPVILPEAKSAEKGSRSNH
jgi:hypothetical protein